MFNNKRGIHGIGILLIFIALILMAVTASTIVISNANSLSQDGMMMYREGNNAFKAFQIIEVAGYDGREQQITRFTIDAKLIGDSMPVNMHHLTLTIGEQDYRSMLRYRGDDSPIINNHSGYITWSKQEFGELNQTTMAIVGTIRPDVGLALSADIDGDGIANDQLFSCDGGASGGPCNAHDGTHLALRLTSTGSQLYYARLVNQSNGAQIDISTTPTNMNVINAEFDGEWGAITIIGMAVPNYQIDSFSCSELSFEKKGELIIADIDDDGNNDYIGLNATHLRIKASNDTGIVPCALGTDLGFPGPISATCEITNGNRYGTLTVSGITTQPNKIDEDVTVLFTPYHNGGGYYVTEHLIRARDSRNGYIVPGDVVRFYVDSYDYVNTDDILDINFIYRNLDFPSKRVYVGNTFPNKDKVVFWPRP